MKRRLARKGICARAVKIVSRLYYLALTWYSIVGLELRICHEFIGVTGPHPEFEEDDDRDGIQFYEPEDGPWDPESDWPLLRDAVMWLCGIDDSETGLLSSVSANQMSDHSPS